MSMAIMRLIKELRADIEELKNKNADLENRLAHMEQRKKPGPKPKAEQDG